MPLIVTSPMAAFVVQIKIAFLLAVVFTFPVFLWRLLSFLAPALHKKELRVLYTLIAPLTALFFAGVLFSYHYVAPITMQFLYEFTGPINALPLLGVHEFVGLTMSLLMVSGATFTVPVFMVLLTAMGAVSHQFWFENARYALVFFLILSAIITPDGSGVSMLLMSAPMSLLYGAGALVCVRVGNKPEFSSSLETKTFNT